MPTQIAGYFKFAVIALLAATTGCIVVYSSNKLVDRQDELSAAHIGGTGLKVDTSNGSITVVKNDRPDVKIFAHIRALDANRLAATKVVTKREQDQTLSVGVEWPDGGPRSNESCDFDILIPDATGLHLTTENGKVEATGLSGRAELRSSNGEIVVDYHNGPVDVQTMNGAVHVKGAYDSVKAEASNGEINMAFTPTATGPVEAHSMNGAIKIQIGPAFAGEMTLDSSNGEVSVDGSVKATKVKHNQRHATLSLAPGDGKSNITTMNGSIRVSALKNQ